MKRFLMLLLHEFKLTASTIPFHLIGIIQPAALFVIMASILVHPTFDMNIVEPQNETQESLIDAMSQIGSPIGFPYINPIYRTMEDFNEKHLEQIVYFDMESEPPTAIQEFGLIDSNIVKNFRNRLTASVLKMRTDQLGSAAITIVEKPLLPTDYPYSIFFGLAIMPMAAFISGTTIGGVLTALEFENHNIQEIKLAPYPVLMAFFARLLRVFLTTMISAGLLYIVVGLVTDFYPQKPFNVFLVLMAMGIIASLVGILAGLITQKTIAAFVIALTSSLGFWLLGSAFGISKGFSSIYQSISRFIPNTYAVELLYREYYNIEVSNPTTAILILSAIIIVLTGVTMSRYLSTIRKQG